MPVIDFGKALQPAINLYGTLEGVRNDRRRLALGERNADIQDRQVAVQEGNLELRRQSDQAQWDKSMQEEVMAAPAIQSAMRRLPVLKGPFLNSVLEDIRSEKITTRRQFRDRMLQARSTGEISELRESLSEEASKALERGEKKRYGVLMGLYQGLSKSNYEDFLDDLMGKPMSIRRSAAERGKGIAEPTGDAYWTNGVLVQPTSQGLRQVGTAPAPTKVSETVVYDPKTGRPVYRQGPAGGRSDVGPTTATQTEVEKKIINLNENIARVDKILTDFDPDLITGQGRIKGALLNLADRWKMKQLTPEEKTFVSQQTSLVANTVKNINMVLKEMSGVAINPEEIKRHELTEPNVAKLFTGDGPTRFKAKARARLESAKMALDRYSGYLATMTPEQAREKATGDFIRFVQGEMDRGGQRGPVGRVEQSTPTGYENMSDDEIKRRLGINR